MPLHASNPDADRRARSHRLKSSVASVVIALLTVTLLMLVLALILLSPLFKETPTIVTYHGALLDDQRITTPQAFNHTRSKPSAPSSAMSRVIAANTVSPTAIPVPEVEVEVVADTFGMGDDFGDGWGGGDGDGFGGGTTFFRQQVSAQRVAYVIDFSLSMKGQGRHQLMRNELSKSIGMLSLGMHYQLIFFAGPAWLAGDQVDMPKARRSATVKSGTKTYDWVCPGGKAHDWEPKGSKQPAPWITVDPSERQKSLKHVAETELVWGTHWQPALEMALAMDPPPQVIFFMTDGVTGGNVMELVRKTGARAKTRGIAINTVAMMEPRAEAAMRELAQRTGGQFSIVRKDGSVKVTPAD